VSTFTLAQRFSLTLIRGPLDEDGIEVDLHNDFLAWGLGDMSTDGNVVIGTTQELLSAQDANRTASFGEVEVLLSVAAYLINDMTMNKLTTWVFVRLRSVCHKRARGHLQYLSETQRKRAAAASTSRANGAARKARGASTQISDLRAELADANNAAREMAAALIHAHGAVRTVASALTLPKAIDLAKKLCVAPPKDKVGCVKLITNDILKPEDQVKAQGIIDTAGDTIDGGDDAAA
jgi:hypothetical protein